MSEKATRKWSGDFYVAIMMLLFTALLVWQYFTIRVPASRMLPGIACIICGVSCLLLFVRVLRGKAAQGTVLLFTGSEICVIAILLACWALMEHLGFYVSLFLLCMGISVLTAKDRSAKKLLKLAAVNVAFIGVVYVLFGVLLQLITPQGLLI